jgi:adhesin transport system membrane fusion protein
MVLVKQIKDSGPSEPENPLPPNGADQEWENINSDWSRERLQKAEAHLLSMFDTDDQMPLSRHLLLGAITSFFVLFVLWANLAKLDEVTRGDGKVIPSSEVQAVQVIEAGIIDEILVREGEEVTAGQVLVRLSDIEASSDLGANQARYLGLLASITRLQAEAEGKEVVEFPPEIMEGAPTSVTEELNSFRANKQQVQSQLNILEQQLMQRNQEIREMESRASDIRGVIQLQREEQSLLEPLVARGSAPRMELLQMERTIKEKTSELNSTLSGLPRARSAVDEVQARIAEIKTNTQAQAQTELAAKLTEMNEIKQRLSALTDRKTRTELKSPVNGTIQELMANTISGVVRPGDDIIKIVPKDDQLIVEAKIRPSDRAFIYPGQSAMVKITAYDFSIYGGLKGEVVDISADTIEDEKDNTFYRVRLRTYESELKRKGEILPIVPGMVASVDILTGEKTVMQYLLKPFLKTMENAFSER